METILSHGGNLERWAWTQDADQVTAESSERTVEFRVIEERGSRLLLEFEGNRIAIHHARQGNRLHLQGPGWWRSFDLVEDDEGDELAGHQVAPVVRAPMPGKVLEILVAVGDSVTAGQAVLRVEAMKMEVDLTAPFDGVVVAVDAEVGTIVDPEQALMSFEPSETE